MGFWSWLTDRTPPGDFTPGDPDGVVVEGEPVEARALPAILPSGWDGWPGGWGAPHWDFGPRFDGLVDVAWACLDLNSSVLSSMPVYRTRRGRVVEPEVWMANPDPTVYSSWAEFAKQLFWDYQLGEAFVLPMAFFSDGWPMRFRVIPPWLVDVNMAAQGRTYRLGGPGGVDVTRDILHIRYKSTTTDPRGVGPLEVAGGRMLTAAVLEKYAREVVQTGGIASQTLETDQSLDAEDAQDLLTTWVETRKLNLGYPPVLDNNVKLVDHKTFSPADMAMLELAQFTEGRIAVLLGVPGFLIDLPGGDDMTYSNVSQVFDYHDRRALRPFAAHVMPALSYWALPPDEAAELNRDEYTRQPFVERAGAWVALKQADLITTEQFQAAERLAGAAAAGALTGGSGAADDVPASAREITEMIQKIYLGVGVVITAEEARNILNRAGAGLSGSFTAQEKP